MPGGTANHEMTGAWIRPLSAVTIIAVMTYVQVGASSEFAPFAPLLIDSRLHLVAAVIAGTAAMHVASGMRDLLLLLYLASVIVIPILVYGALTLALWISLAGGTMLLDMFVLRVTQRMVIYIMTVGSLNAVGMLVGMLTLRVLRR